MRMAHYMVRQSEQGYELVRVRPISRPNPLWTIGGTLVAWMGLKRRTLPGLAMATAGAVMIYCGNDGIAQWRKRVEPEHNTGERTRNPMNKTSNSSNAPGRMAADESAEWSHATPHPQTGPSYQNDGERRAKQIPCDPIEEASMQSFPASDPPAY